MNWWVVSNIVTTVVMLIANGLATGLPLGGRTTGQISDSVSGIIYTGRICILNLGNHLYRFDRFFHIPGAAITAE